MNMEHTCERCGKKELGLGWPSPNVCAECHPKWVCNNCGHIERKEEEVTCWECGIGEMLYVPGKQDAKHIAKIEALKSPNEKGQR